MLPSDLALRYMPELRRMRVTPADRYMFDRAATARWTDLQREADEHRRQGGQAQRHPAPQSPASRAHQAHQSVQETGDRLAIQGTEIPPWDSRYRGKRG